MVSAAIETWQQQHNLDPYAEDSFGPSFSLKPPLWYRSEITSAKMGTSKLNDRQLVLHLAIKDADDKKLGELTHYLQLPCQESDSRFDADKLKKITYRRRDEICRLLRAAGLVKADTKPPEDKKQTLDWCAEHLAAGDDAQVDLAGVNFYLQTKANDKKPEYPHCNIRIQLTSDAKVFEGDEEVPF